MPRRIRIYPYKMASRSAVSLKYALRNEGYNPLMVYENGRYQPRNSDFIINWGNPRTPDWARNLAEVEGLNNPSAVAAAGNKFTTLTMLNGNARIPDYTTSKELAVSWIEGGETVVERLLLNSSGGRGIRIVRGIDELSDLAPLYTKYVKKLEEYRIHVGKVDGEDAKVISVQQKRKRVDVPNENVNYQIRNADNGWVFCRENVDPPIDVLNEALNAFNTMNEISFLDFGAVDVGYNTQRNEATVYEINTAPGLEGQTITDYVNFIKECL